MQQEQERMVNETLVKESTHRSSFSPRILFMDKIKVRKEKTKGEGHLDQQEYFLKVNSLMNSKNQNQDLTIHIQRLHN